MKFKCQNCEQCLTQITSSVAIPHGEYYNLLNNRPIMPFDLDSDSGIPLKSTLQPRLKKTEWQTSLQNIEFSVTLMMPELGCSPSRPLNHCLSSATCRCQTFPRQEIHLQWRRILRLNHCHYLYPPDRWRPVSLLQVLLPSQSGSIKGLLEMNMKVLLNVQMKLWAGTSQCSEDTNASTDPSYCPLHGEYLRLKHRELNDSQLQCEMMEQERSN